MKPLIAITGQGSISPVTRGLKSDYRSSKAFFTPLDHAQGALGAALHASEDQLVEALRHEHKHFQHLDRSVILAILAAREAFRQAGWQRADAANTGINIGSARGATTNLERTHQQFLDPTKELSPFTSPTTTSGSLSSWLAADLETQGVAFSHSVTCSSGLQALGNAMAWLRAGMADRFLAGGTEAPLTGYTVAQMQALKIYASHQPYPCQPLAKNRPEGIGMVLGEGAAVFALENRDADSLSDALAVVESYGAGRDKAVSATAISKDGFPLQQSMQAAINQMQTADPVDAVIVHAPGTSLGDEAELSALHAVFGEELPMLLSNKWQIGHLLGASGALALEYALGIFQEENFSEFPYPVKEQGKRRPINKIMLNSAGFGGNASSVIVSRPALFQSTHSSN